LDVKLQIHHEVVSIPVVKCIVCNDTIKLKTEKSSKLTIGMKGFEYKKFLSGFCEKCKTSYYLDCFEKDEKNFGTTIFRILIILVQVARKLLR
jgi:hypothetical protein